MTPREYFSLLSRRKELDRMANYRAGLAAAAIYNVNITDSSKRVEPMDFFETRPLRFADPELLNLRLTAWANAVKGTR